MTLVIGTDEAGYGPNLGPLVLAATAWRCTGAPHEVEEALADAATEAGAAAGTGRLWGDSKEIYRAGDGMEALERGVVAGLVLTGAEPPRRWAGLERSVGPISPDAGGEWGGLPSLIVPQAAALADCLAAAAAAREPLDRRGVSLHRIACRCIYPREFNGLLGRGLNKSDILSQATLDLAAALRADAADEPAVVWCDRHGGRKRYGGLVSRHFDAPLVRPVEETPTRSAYDVPAAAAAACRVEFCVGGESRPPVALASMTAKYVRELAMLAFNAFWSGCEPGLAPTAGYPTDAVRWRRDAAAAIARERVADDDLWRRALATPPAGGVAAARPRTHNPRMPRLTTHLYIVRHAWAEDQAPGVDDHARPLTKKGRKRFAAMMERLRDAGMKVDIVATSPLVRALQTAEILADALDTRPPVEVVDALAPACDWQALVEWTADQDAARVAWVGHMPCVARLVALTIGDGSAAIRMQKGAVASIRLDDGPGQPGELEWLATDAIL